MKHTLYNEILPYTYYVRNIETNEKYYGVRYGNITKGLTPEEDLGIEYYTSSKYVENDFKTNRELFEYRVHYTFDTVDEALEYESELLTKVYKRDDWYNKTNNKSIHNDAETLKIIAEKLSILRKNNPLYSGVNHPMYGKKHSVEAKKE